MIACSPRPASSSRAKPPYSAVLEDVGTGSGVRRMWVLLRGKRRLALVQTMLSLLEGFVEAAILTLFARIALAVVEEEPRSVFIPGVGDRSLSSGLWVVAALVVLRMLVGLAASLLVAQLQFRMVTELRGEIVASYGEASWLSQSHLDEGGLQQLLITLPLSISGLLLVLLGQLGSLLIMIAMLTFAGLADVALTLGLIGAIILVTSGFIPLRRWIKRRSRTAVDLQRGLSTSVAEFASMKFEVQSLGLTTRFTAPLLEAIRKEGRVTRRLSIGKGMVVPAYMVVTYLAVTAGLIVLSNSEVDRLDQIGPILLVVLRSLSYGQALQSAGISFASLTPLLDSVHESFVNLQRSKAEWGTTQPGEIDSIQFDHVTFSYDDGPDALSDVHVEIRRGSKVGVVGPSGGGKSTLVRLLLGLLVPSEGKVLVNGVTLHSLDRDSWSQKVGVVPQFAGVFGGTVADNIRFFREDIPDGAIWDALRIADFAAEVDELAERLDTRIGSGGRMLSGGQQQRLAIARAVVTKPALVVMDEPTSSIDSDSEAAVSDAMASFDDETTLVIVSHRMRILQGCDQILRVENGRVEAIDPSDLRGEDLSADAKCEDDR